MLPFIRNTIIGCAVIIVFSLIAIYNGLWMHPLSWITLIIGALGIIFTGIIAHLEIKHPKDRSKNKQ